MRWQLHKIKGFNRIILLLLVLVMLINRPVMAQTGDYPPNYVATPTPPLPRKAPAKRDTTYGKSAVSINLLLLFRSAYLLSYEQMLSHHFALEIGAGITRDDNIFEAAGRYPYKAPFSDYSSGPYTVQNGGYCYNLALNYFPRSTTGLHGLYLGLFLRKFVYHVSVENTSFYISEKYISPDDPDNIESYKGPYNANYSYFDLGLKIGKKCGFRRIKWLYYDYFAGLGYRHIYQTDFVGQRNERHYVGNKLIIPGHQNVRREDDLWLYLGLSAGMKF